MQVLTKIFRQLAPNANASCLCSDEDRGERERQDDFAILTRSDNDLHSGSTDHV